MFAGAMVVALAVEGVLAWPAPLFARIGHPVTWAGRLIDACDQAFNRDSDSPRTRRLKGVAVALGIATLAWGIGDLLVGLLPGGWLGTVLTGVLAWPLVAARSLDDHVARVAAPLAQGDLDGARAAVAMIVGRDPATLDQAGVARAALESLAESASDGVVAPLFWGVIFGLPGIAAYKAINTMDSMIGHLSPRHAAFGWAAARIDDLVNLIPARLTAALFVALAGRQWREAWTVVRADARHHRSPNAGWPEAALAGALGVRLSGPRVYDGQVSVEPWVNSIAPDPGPADLKAGLLFYRQAIWGLAVLLLILAVV